MTCDASANVPQRIYHISIYIFHTAVYSITDIPDRKSSRVSQERKRTRWDRDKGVADVALLATVPAGLLSPPTQRPGITL